LIERALAYLATTARAAREMRTAPAHRPGTAWYRPEMLAFSETSLDSLLWPLLVAAGAMAALRVAVRVCRSVTRARDARLIARARETRFKPARNS
jgi:hypothetical protein